MDRIIYCVFLKRHAIGLNFQCYPGSIGKYIFENISKEIWNKWLEKQIIIINELKLDLSIYDNRKILEQKMISFLFKKKETN